VWLEPAAAFLSPDKKNLVLKLVKEEWVCCIKVK